MVRERQHTGFLPSRVFACVTLAIFVIFVVFRGLSSKTLVFLGQNAHSSFSPFPSRPVVFGRGQSARLAKKPFCPDGQGKTQHTNKQPHYNKFAGLSRDWVGGKKYAYVSFGVNFLCGEAKEHKNKINPKIPGQSPQHFVYVFFSSVLFSLPRWEDAWKRPEAPKLVNRLDNLRKIHRTLI